MSRGEVVFHRLKLRYKTANVAETNEEKILGHHWESSPTWGHLWFPP
ncbi:hypothetical protein E2C01_048783 [Portunus trituberculatus]|uniref:Uncharacterized protein n=1 Tax=Portunus trituberculatus TaxID=210409 RepID=A0A5B7GEA7_PORTR|nr:hypothetical protein [Portunus trituberculatus]